MGFTGLIGHERPLGLLRAMLRRNRLPHALLITGLKGVGKRTLALALAQAVNCLAPQDIEPCGVCTACRKIERGVHSDVTEITPEGRLRVIKIDTIRELRSQAAFRPYEGKNKVYIILEAERMTAEAANALLKTLEEPPPASLIILTTPDDSSLLPTIVSRCLRLNLAPLPRPTIEAWLSRERGLPPDQARLLAALSDGCLGGLIDADLDALLTRRRQVMDRMMRLTREGPALALEWAEELAGDQENWPETFKFLRFWLRDRLILAGGAGENRLVNRDLMNEKETDRLKPKLEAYLQGLTEIDQAEEALHRLVRPEIVWENLMLTLADMERI